MFALSIPWWEFVVRGVVVYVSLLVLLRLSGRKQVGQLSPFDFVLLLILSNAEQNSMNGGDNSLIGGLIIAVALVLLNLGISFLNVKSRKISQIIEGKPEVFIHNGKVNEKTLIKERISHEELRSILREHGLERVDQVKFAVIEPGGEISIIARK